LCGRAAKRQLTFAAAHENLALRLSEIRARFIDRAFSWQGLIKMSGLALLTSDPYHIEAFST